MPLDLERRYGLVGGNIVHGHMSLDRLWPARPPLGHSDYRSPIAGLYMCDAGMHPGGGVSGLPGHNAAREVTRDGSLWTAGAVGAGRTLRIFAALRNRAFRGAL
jgi:phytoene dehydrogenase-like protein